MRIQTVSFLRRTFVFMGGLATIVFFCGCGSIWGGIDGVTAMKIISDNGLGTNLKIAYGFSEGAGSVSVDESGNSNTLSLSNVTWVSGYSGDGGSFDGSSSAATVASPVGISAPTTISYMAWVYPTADSGSGEHVIMDFFNGTFAYGFESFDYSGSNGYTGYPDCYLSVGLVGGIAKLPLNTWSHLACTYDGATLIIYLNGVAVNSLSTSGTITSGTGSLYIGWDPNNSPAGYFQGRIDDFRLYINRVLSASEIALAMSSALP